VHERFLLLSRAQSDASEVRIAIDNARRELQSFGLSSSPLAGEGGGK
jgi:hypothetical protein